MKIAVDALSLRTVWIETRAELLRKDHGRSAMHGHPFSQYEPLTELEKYLIKQLHYSQVV